MESFTKFLGSLAMLILIPLYSGLCWGVTVDHYWDWFILPVFSGLPVLTYVQAAGIGAFIQLFKGSYPRKVPAEEHSYLYWIVVIAPWISLFIGWILHLVIN